MSEPGHARFTLAIESKTDPVTGTVRSGRAHTGIPSGEGQQ